MWILSLLLLFLTASYGVALLLIRRGLFRLRHGTHPVQPDVSILIAARNEADNIGTCLRAVLDQSYPKAKLEVIVIDDRSTDSTAEIVGQFAAQDRRVQLLHIREIQPGISPKKGALDRGIREARGEIIVTTDADCTPAPEWITEMMTHFTPEVGMVAGFNPYRIEGKKFSWLQKMLALDYFSLACVAAASAGLGYAVSCSGGNLAYRKEIYLQLGGFKDIQRWISGDDDFFLEQIREKTNWKIRYSVMPQTFVPTAPPATFREFLNQRIRYASKGRHYAAPVAAALVGIYVLNGLLAGGLLLIPFHPTFALIWSAAMLAKSLAELLFLKNGETVFRYPVNIRVYAITALFHPFYIVVIGLLGQTRGFRWKGEAYSARVTASPSSDAIHEPISVQRGVRF